MDDTDLARVLIGELRVGGPLIGKLGAVAVTHLSELGKRLPSLKSEIDGILENVSRRGGYAARAVELTHRGRKGSGNV